MTVNFKDEREPYLLSKGWVKTATDRYVWTYKDNISPTTEYTLLEAYNYEMCYNAMSCL